MKYESDILKRLIDTYGVVGNPQYISEIIKEFIVQGKECYPNLFTYQSDWLAHIDEFGLNPTYTVSYTGQSIYAPNTLERPVKRAILKGSTKYRDIDTGEILETFEDGRNLELVSVRMPVLTTTGKNLFDGVSYIDGFVASSNDFTVMYDTDVTSILVNVNKNTDYILSAKTSFNRSIIGGSLEPISIGTKTTKIEPSLISSNTLKFNSGEFTHIIIYLNNTKIDIEELQVEDGSVATSYEPYKSNILTVNEPIELRGIGEVRDTLDLLTGEIVQSIGEIVLDGSEDEKWTFHEGYDIFVCEDLVYNENYLSTHVLSKTTWGGIERFDLTPSHYGITSASSGREYLSNNPITIQYQLATESIKTVDLTILDQNGQNVKQLMAFNGGTHFNTGSLEGSPLPSVTVTVETDLEETIKVCSLEGNTM